MQLRRTCAELFGQCQGGAFGDAEAATLAMGEGRAVAQSWLETGQVGCAEKHQRQAQLCSQLLQAGFVAFELDAGQALERRARYIVLLQGLFEQGAQLTGRAALLTTKAGHQDRRMLGLAHQAWLLRRNNQALIRPRAIQNRALVNSEAILNCDSSASGARLSWTSG
ncbi:hypothetical protein D3C84_898460 [compost metagenome]